MFIIVNCYQKLYSVRYNYFFSLRQMNLSCYLIVGRWRLTVDLVLGPIFSFDQCNIWLQLISSRFIWSAIYSVWPSSGDVQNMVKKQPPTRHVAHTKFHFNGKEKDKKRRNTRSKRWLVDKRVYLGFVFLTVDTLLRSVTWICFVVKDNCNIQMCGWYSDGWQC